MSYRPITDVWLLARSRVGFYGAYPYGFLERARALLGCSYDDSVLHVCSGKLRKYPYRGLGPNDKLVDINFDNEPDFVYDVTQSLPNSLNGGWPAILADPPYSEKDALEYGAAEYPEPNALLRLCLQSVRKGGRVGILHYYAPRPPKTVEDCKIKLVALVAVLNGYKNRIRCFSVFEKQN